MQNKYRTLLSNTALISAGTFGSKLLSFLMVRFYTGLLTPSAYGTADLLVQTANLLLPVVSLGISNGVFRFGLDCPEARRRAFSVGLYIVTVGALTLGGVTLALSRISPAPGYLGLIACYTICSCYHSLCAQFVRAEGKTSLFAGQGVLNTALVIGLNLLLLVGFRLGVVGYVLSIALADGLCTGYLIWKERLWRLPVRHPGQDLLRRMLRYSVPLIPTTIFWWITNVSDRYMIAFLLGEQANGLYAVACKVPTILTLCSNGFLEAWQFSAISEAAQSREVYVEFYSQIWSAFQCGMLLVASAVIALSQGAIRLLSTQEYYGAWQYVPVLSMAMVFSVFSSFMGSVYVVKKKSGLSFWTAMAGAGVNVTLNLMLIPSLGLQGAALATLASYLLSFAIRAASAVRLIPFRLSTRRLLRGVGIVTAQMVFSVCQLPGWAAVQMVGFTLLLLEGWQPLRMAAGEALRSIRKM